MLRRTPSSRRRTISMSIVIHAILASPALADPQQIAALQSTRRDIAVSVRADRPDATYSIGEPLRMQLMATADVYVVVLSIGGSGKISVLIPNAVDRTVRLQSNRMLEIPTPNGPYNIRVQGPAGLELIKVIGTTEPIEPPSGDIPALARDLPTILDRQVMRGYAVSDLVIRIIEGPRPGR